MANYHTLVNQTLRRFGAPTVTQANFANTSDPQVVLAKNAVNDALREINEIEYEWPFNYTTAEIVCVAGTQRYSAPSSAKSIDWQSFILENNSTLNVGTTRVHEISYDDWLNNYAVRDGDAGSGDYDTPIRVFKYPNGDIGLTPIPDQAYTIKFDTYSYPSNLTNAADSSRVPAAYDHVIVNGACRYLAAHRSNEAMMQLYTQEFQRGISRMRTILINDWVNIRDSRINRPRYSSRGFLRTS